MEAMTFAFFIEATESRVDGGAAPFDEGDDDVRLLFERLLCSAS